MPDSSFFVNKAGPIHASEYISTDLVLLASGAGPSKTGQKNRIAAYSISQSSASSDNPLERHGVVVAEALLADDEDAPSSLALHDDLILAGANESAAARQASGDNHHLRTFRLQRTSTEDGEVLAIKKSLQHQVYDDLSMAKDDYQKLTKISADGHYAGLLSSEGIPAIVDLVKMTPLNIFASTRGDGDDKESSSSADPTIDLEFVKDAVWTVTAKSITTTSIPAGDEVRVIFSLAESAVPKNFRLVKVLSLSHDTVLLGLNHTAMDYGFASIFKVSKGKLLQILVAHTKARIRGMYINTQNPSHNLAQLIVLTTSDGSVMLYDNDLMQRKVWKKLHQFPVSTVAFRKDAKQMITCSIDEKINVLDLTDLRPPTSIITIFIVLMLIALFIFIVMQCRAGAHEYWLTELDRLMTDHNRGFQDL